MTGVQTCALPIFVKKKKIFLRYNSTKNNYLNKYNELTLIIGKEIQKYESIKTENLIKKSDNFYSFYKKIKNITKDQNLTSFKDSNGNVVSDGKLIVEKFKELFESKFVNESNTSDPLICSDNLKLDFIDISMNDIILAMNAFNGNKSEGFTFIKSKIIKSCLNGVSKLLYCLFNQILKFKEIPNELKLSIVSPILKQNKNKMYFNSYRCVSVQPNLYRIFESILLKKIMSFINKRQIIPNSQYGYRTGVSVFNLHIDMQNVIFKALNDIKVIAIDIIFLDLSDAFDSVFHKRLLKKIFLYGFQGLIFDILKSNFTDRVQYVLYNNVKSTIIKVISGVMQGGVLSPTLFNIYMSDLVKVIVSTIFQFCDDLSLIRVIYSLDDCLQLQKDLNSTASYCKENALKLNPNKCEHLRVTLKKCDLPLYTIGDKNVELVNNHKHVGIIYDNKMSFNLHIDMIIAKALKKFYTLKTICNSIDGKTFLKLYVTYILPILEYSNLCLTLTESQSIRLEKIQRKITKFLCFKLNQNVFNYEERLKFLNIQSLEKRRKIQALKVLFRIKINTKNVPTN